MKTRIFAALLAILFCACCFAPMSVFAEAAEESTKSLPEGLTIACVGDSITYGSGSAATATDPTSVVKDDTKNYPAILANLIGGTPTITGGGNGTTNVTFQNEKVTIYNDGKASTAVLNDPIAGDEFAKGALNVPTLVNSFARQDLDIVVLMLGTNDSKISDFRGDKADKKYEQGNWDTRTSTHDTTIGEALDADGNPLLFYTPKQEFELRYRAIIDKYLNMESAPYIYCMLPIPCASEGKEADQDYSKSYRISDKNMREEINPIITSIVEDLQKEGKPIGLIDMRAAFPDPTKDGVEELCKYLVDEVHPNPDGYQIMAETVYERLLADTHQVSYVVEDGDEGAVAPKASVVFGDNEIVVKSTRGMLTKNGVANIGWSTEPNGEGTVYQEGEKIAFKSGDSDITLYPVWGSAPSGDATVLIIAIIGGIAVIGLFAAGAVVLKKNNKKD